MIEMVLGVFDVVPFEFGESQEAEFLYFLFIIASFVIMIHLLNMLIAIMGNTFAERHEVAEQIKYKDHLNFVLDNWFILDRAFGGDLSKV